MLIGLRRLCSLLSRRPPTSKRNFAPSLKALPVVQGELMAPALQPTRSRRPPAIATAAATACLSLSTTGTHERSGDGRGPRGVIAHREARLSKARCRRPASRRAARGGAGSRARAAGARRRRIRGRTPYARGVISRYIGTGRMGHREESRDEDRRRLQRYALVISPPTSGGATSARCRSPSHRLARRQPSRRGVTLADRLVRNALKPVRIGPATAKSVKGMIGQQPRVRGRAASTATTSTTTTTNCSACVLGETPTQPSSASSSPPSGDVRASPLRPACAVKVLCSRSGPWRSTGKSATRQGGPGACAA